MRSMGHKMREHYKSQMFPGPGLAVDISVRSSPVNRCIESAHNLVQGLSHGSDFKPTVDPLLGLIKPEVTIGFMDVYPKFQDVIEDALSGTEGVEQMTDREKIFQTLVHCDNVRTCVSIGRSLPSSITMQMRKRQAEFLTTFSSLCLSDPEKKKTIAQPILQSMIKDMTNAAKSGRRTIFLCATHDLVVDAVLSFISPIPGPSPLDLQFGTNMTFELLGQSSERKVHVMFSPNPDEYPGQTVLSVNADQFNELID